MYQFTYENQGEKTYLVYSVQTSDILDSVNMGMMSNNKIPGIAAVSFTQMNADRFVKYDISSRIPVAELFSRPVKRKCLLNVFSGIAEGLLSAQDYMLEAGAMVLDPAHIYADVSGEKVQLICMPIMVNTPQPDLHNFFKNMVFNTQCDPTEGGDYFVRIVNYLNTEPFSLQNFKNLLKTLAAPVAPMPQRPVQPVPAQSRAAAPAAPAQSAPAPQPQRPVAPAAPARPAAAPARPVQPAPQAPQRPVPPAPAPAQAPQAPEKEISFIGLLRHYDKETAAAYKAQQSAKKAAAEANQPSKKEKAPANAGFAIPGQPQPAPAAPVRPAAQAPVRPAAPAPVKPAAAPQRPVAPAPQKAAPAQVSPAAAAGSPAPSYTGSLKSNFGETIMLGGGGIGETISIFEPQKAAAVLAPHLIRVKNNERIPVTNASFRIGRDPGFADYCVSDNDSVGRSHANIITHGDKYFVMDTNSRNHTYVNGEMIQSNVEVEIKHGDVISVANEEFQFKVI